jgi:hypothetical protein
MYQKTINQKEWYIATNRLRQANLVIDAERNCETYDERINGLWISLCMYKSRCLVNYRYLLLFYSKVKFSTVFHSVVDPYSFFPDPDPDPDPECAVGDQYGSGSGFRIRIRIQIQYGSRALMTKN